MMCEPCGCQMDKYSPQQYEEHRAKFVETQLTTLRTQLAERDAEVGRLKDLMMTKSAQIVAYEAHWVPSKQLAERDEDVKIWRQKAVDEQEMKEEAEADNAAMQKVVDKAILWHDDTQEKIDAMSHTLDMVDLDLYIAVKSLKEDTDDEM